MRRLLRLLSLLLVILASSSAHAYKQWDYTDLWYMPGEDGWGMNIAQQGDTLFATVFVYGSDRKPTWFVASSITYSGIQDSKTVFDGTLYQTTGPAFSTSTFDPHGVAIRTVGTIKLQFRDPVAAYLTYTVDGVSVFKEIRRQTWKANDLTGSYIGHVVGAYNGAGCSRTGYQEEPATFTISSSGTKVTIVATGTSSTCTYTGDYIQWGRMGDIEGPNNGAMSCTDGTQAFFQLVPVEVSPVGFTAAGIAGTATCTWSGHLGGIVRSELPN